VAQLISTRLESSSLRSVSECDLRHFLLLDLLFQLLIMLPLSAIMPSQSTAILCLKREGYIRKQMVGKEQCYHIADRNSIRITIHGFDMF
jgi:hypothetical protein